MFTFANSHNTIVLETNNAPSSYSSICAFSLIIETTCLAILSDTNNSIFIFGINQQSIRLLCIGQYALSLSQFPRSRKK